MRKLTIMMSVLLSVVLFSACSKDDNDEENVNGSYGFSSGLMSECYAPSFSHGDINVLFIQDENGKIDTCGLYQPYCGTTGPITTTGGDNTTFEDYPMVFSAGMWYSHNFDELQLGIENRDNRRIEDLKVGDSFSTSPFDPNNKIYIKVWWEDILTLDLPYQNLGGALNGRIEVIDKKIADEGAILSTAIDSYITLSFQDLEFYAYDKDNNKHNYTVNGLVEFRICEDGLYPKPQESSFDMETAVIPSDDLISFMMNALYKNESEGRKTFFSQAAEEEKCLIINSVSELREAYHGDMEIPSLGIDFDHCSLVIGRTYGEHGGISLGDYEFVDNGDSYQLNLTLNNNVNPDYCYTAAFVDLYFWKICPKMENKSVVFNRIRKDVNIDPMQEYSLIRKRWFLQSYSDADGTLRMFDNKGWGDERYSIEFKENGRVEGVINTNDFSGYYMLPHMMTIDGKRDGYNGDLHYGLINLMNINVTEVADDEPLSKAFMHIFDATEIKVWSEDIMTIKNSDGEIFGFFRENIKEIYGYK